LARFPWPSLPLVAGVSGARLRFRAAIRSISGGGVINSVETVSPLLEGPKFGIRLPPAASHQRTSRLSERQDRGRTPCLPRNPQAISSPLPLTLNNSLRQGYPGRKHRIAHISGGRRGRSQLSTTRPRRDIGGTTLREGIVLLCFDLDDFGIAWAEAAQFMAYRTGIVFLIEQLLPLVIGRPAAVGAVIPPGDPRIGSGSKCDAVRHCALLFHPSKGCCRVYAKFRTMAYPNRRHRTD